MDKDKKLNITKIDQTWSSCSYKYRVFVEPFGIDVKRHNYIGETLSKWFGDAIYFSKYCWLAGKK